MALTQAITDGFTSIVGAASVLTQPEDIIPYSFDGTAALRQLPAAVVFPQTTEDVSRCVQFAGAQSLAIVTRGSGTGLSGGSVPSSGSVVLCMTQMNKILEIDPRNLVLRTQPGVTTLAIDDAAARHGLFYPPDPGSMRISLIPEGGEKSTPGFSASATFMKSLTMGAARCPPVAPRARCRGLSYPM